MAVGGRRLAGLILPLLVLSGCEPNEVRQGREVMGLVRKMRADLQASAAQSAAVFSRREDFEALRRAFGTEPFDGGTPLGPDFLGSMETMVRDLEAQLDKEPKNAEFPRKAALRVRQFAQWWSFVRRHLETRRDRLAADAEVSRLLGPGARREQVLTVLSEVIKAVSAFESITFRTVREVEGILARS